MLLAVKIYVNSQRVKDIFMGWGTVLYKVVMIKRTLGVKARSMGDNQLTKFPSMVLYQDE